MRKIFSHWRLEPVYDDTYMPQTRPTSNWKHASQVNLKRVVDQIYLTLLWELKILNDWYFHLFFFLVTGF